MLNIHVRGILKKQTYAWIKIQNKHKKGGKHYDKRECTPASTDWDKVRKEYENKKMWKQASAGCV